VDGERFNIMRSGVHELLRLPRRAQSRSGDSDAEPLLDVMASVEWDKKDCNDPYVKEVELKGWWLRSAGSLLFRTQGAAPGADGAVVLEVNGSRLGPEELAHDRRVTSFLRASVPGRGDHAGPQHKIRRARFLTVQLRLPAVTLKIDFVNRAVPGSAINHLNFIASDLRRFSETTGMDIGGLLGRDAHSWAASASEGCAPQQDLRAARPYESELLDLRPTLAPRSLAGSQQIAATL